MLRVWTIWILALGLCKIELVSASTLERRLNWIWEVICHVGLCTTVAVGTLESIPDRSPSDVADRPAPAPALYTLPPNEILCNTMSGVSRACLLSRPCRAEDGRQYFLQHRSSFVCVHLCAAGKLTSNLVPPMSVALWRAFREQQVSLLWLTYPPRSPRSVFSTPVAVKNVNKDIERLWRKVSNIKGVLEKIKRLLDGRDKTLLLATYKLSDSLSNSVNEGFLQLQELRVQLEPGKTHKTMSLFGIQALRWPFTSKEVEKLFASLEGYEQTYTLALQKDGV